MKYGLIGEKLGHSFSAEIHKQIANYEYELKEIPREQIEEFFRKKDFCAINVTIPYKADIIKYLDFVDENAKNIGAVNTVVNKSGKLIGYNTDFGGLIALIKTKFDDLKGKSALILGDGATSRTAFAALQKLGAKEIFIVSRHPKNNQISYSDAENKFRDVNVILNATPVGMYPNTDNTPINLDNFSNLELVVDVIYNPLKTNLLISAEEKGVTALSGLYMLVAQAVLAAGHFADQTFPEDVITSIYKSLLLKKRNIVLTGMPGCGKTTIGKVLAKLTDKKFVDTDELIVQKSGLQITEIFKKFGEDYFRNLESEIIAEISLQNDLIISTGGGAVLRKENVINLKHNGIIFFLDRELEQLLPTADRPLASSNEKIIKLYNERIEIYNETSDKKIRVIDPEITAKEILRNFRKEN